MCLLITHRFQNAFKVSDSHFGTLLAFTTDKNAKHISVDRRFTRHDSNACVNEKYHAMFSDECKFWKHGIDVEGASFHRQ